jgi:hypothetical protein
MPINRCEDCGRLFDAVDQQDAEPYCSPEHRQRAHERLRPTPPRPPRPAPKTSVGEAWQTYAARSEGMDHDDVLGSLLRAKYGIVDRTNTKPRGRK